MNDIKETSEVRGQASANAEVRCVFCQTANQVEAYRCSHCERRLYVVCEQCQERNPRERKRCAQCGASLEAPWLTRLKRRLFGDRYRRQAIVRTLLLLGLLLLVILIPGLVMLKMLAR